MGSENKVLEGKKFSFLFPVSAIRGPRGLRARGLRDYINVVKLLGVN